VELYDTEKREEGQGVENGRFPVGGLRRKGYPQGEYGGNRYITVK